MARTVRRTRSTAGGLALVLLVLVTGACSSTKKPEADAAAFESTDPVILIEAAERTAALPYRFHSTLSVEGGDGALTEVGAVLDAAALTKLLDIKGTVVGDDRELRVKTSVVAGYLDGMDIDLPVDPVGLQTEARRIEGVWYVRAPRTLFIAALQGIGAELPVESAELDHLVSGWVRLDEGARAEDVEAFSRTALLGSDEWQRVLDPVDVLEQLRHATDVESAPGTFEGEEVTVVHATIDFVTGKAGGASEGDTSTTQAQHDVPIRIEAAIDEHGRLLSVSYGMTFGDLLGLAVPTVDVSIGGTSGDVGPFAELRQVIRTNFLDVGVGELEVLPPEVFGVVTLDD